MMRLICGNFAGNNQKGFSPILILLLVLVLLGSIGVGGYLLRDKIPFLQNNTGVNDLVIGSSAPVVDAQIARSSSDSAEIQGYRSYIDSEMGVTFKIPSNWFANKSASSEGYGDGESCVFFSEMQDWRTVKNLGNSEPPLNDMSVCRRKGKVEPGIYSNGAEEPNPTMVAYQTNGLKGLKGQSDNIADDFPADVAILASNIDPAYVYDLGRFIGARAEFVVLLKSFREIK